MRILAADDEKLMLERLTGSIREACPDADVYSFGSAQELLGFVSGSKQSYEVAFLDVQMSGMNGISLAQCLKYMIPKINIIFVTGFSEYKSDAMDLRASGYVTKPVTCDKIRRELEELRYPVEESKPVEPNREELIRVQCFGNFDVFDLEGNPIHFSRSKAKELLAYLICKKGARCTSRELIGILFENVEYDKKIRDYFQHVVSALMTSLRNVNAEAVIIRERQNYAVNVRLVDCDYYKEELMGSQAGYMGEFMNQYSWAEFYTGYLEDLR